MTPRQITQLRKALRLTQQQPRGGYLRALQELQKKAKQKLN